MQEDVQEQSDITESTNSRPAARFTGSGGISVAIWKHKSDKGFDSYSVRIDRTFKNGEDFQSTPYLRDSDLLRTAELIKQADQWIEQDKGKQRGVLSGQAR